MPPLYLIIVPEARWISYANEFLHVCIDSIAKRQK